MRQGAFRAVALAAGATIALAAPAMAAPTVTPPSSAHALTATGPVTAPAATPEQQIAPTAPKVTIPTVPGAQTTPAPATKSTPDQSPTVTARSGPESSSSNKDCTRDFSTQPQAQRYFDSHGGSRSNNYDGLDRNRNGKACESLPGGSQGSSSPAASSAPNGGPNTGLGGTAPTGHDTLPGFVAIGFGALLLAGVGAIVLRGRRST